jgi:hypothetical protein
MRYAASFELSRERVVKTNVAEIYDRTRVWRVVIFRRDDGSFGFEDQ